jgi:hypothetical protein
MKEMRSGNIEPKSNDAKSAEIQLSNETRRVTTSERFQPFKRCHTRAKTLDALMKRMREAVALCLESEDGNPSAGTEFSKFLYDPLTSTPQPSLTSPFA